ncbi:NTE family protein [Cyclonatronum proteinivorum]|uniref:NTE family protein n=1 Tax=Cyclonatronum proteinivorum TaxID=1457365 RepID=A0A345UJ06_9BACT|nr:patatin-like phospholipase family protein [Cyclonatronum proteinivorum]AXJ00458.1 NTE family protein [Cyclonatronum proteinivorum]
MSSNKIALALGGGAILGAAHIGILRAIEEKQIEVTHISGTSIGALVAGLFAFGLDSHKIESLMSELEWLDVSSFSLSKFGFLSNDKMADIADDYIKDVDIEDADIPLAIIATDVGKGEKVVFTSGKLSVAVRASTCIPGVFIPVEHEGRMLVDGGIMENVPVSPLVEMGASHIVAVDLNANRKYDKPEDVIDVMINAMDIALDNAAQLQSEDANVIIAPELHGFSRSDPEALKDLIKIGYDTAMKHL